MDPLAIIIVDDQTLFRKNLQIMIEMYIPTAKVVGIAGNGYEALEICRNTPHNLILLDMRMPEMDGVECIRRLRAEGNNAKIIVLTTFDDDEYVFKALKYGAVGYLLKDIEPEELINAILRVCNGDTLVSPKVTAKLVKEVTRYGIADLGNSSELLSRLTPRELDVLKHIAMGEGNREIARNLQLAEGTVKNHVSTIYEKLELTDRAQAIRFAIINNLI